MVKSNFVQDRQSMHNWQVHIGIVSAVIVAGMGGWWMARADLSIDDFLLLSIGIVLISPIMLRILNRRFDIFEPLVMFSAAMMLFVVVRPALLIRTDDFVWRDIYDTHSGLTRMLVVALVGVSAWIIGYELANHINFHPKVKSSHLSLNRNVVTVLTVMMSVASLALYLLFLRRAGLPLTWFLTRRNSFDDMFRGSSGYLYSAPSLLIPASVLALMVWQMGRKWLYFTVLLAGAPLLLSIILKGGRLFLIQLGLGMIVFYFLSHRKRPRAHSVLFTLVAAFVVVSVLRETRSESSPQPFISTAIAVVEEPIEALNDIVLKADTEAGQGLMFLVSFVPGVQPHVPGSSVTTLVAQPIPRTLWSNKPKIPEESIMEAAFPEDYARSRAGATFTAMGTFYFDSGMIGVTLGMMTTGVAFGAAWRYLTQSGTLAALALASVLPSATLAFARASIYPATLILFWTALPILSTILIAQHRDKLHIRFVRSQP